MELEGQEMEKGGSLVERVMRGQDNRDAKVDPEIDEVMHLSQDCATFNTRFFVC